jgi:hypothetical protein
MAFIPRSDSVRVYLVVLAAFALAVTTSARRLQGQPAPLAPGPARVWQDTVMIPAYEDGLPDPNPPFDLFQPGRFN